MKLTHLLETLEPWFWRRAFLTGSLSMGVVVLAGIALPAHAVGPRVGSKPEEYVVPIAPVAPLRPLVIPDQPAIAAYDRFREALLESSPRGWFGIGLQCSNCSISREDSASVWHFESAPTIQYVDPDGPAEKAGLRSGDVLTHVDGVSITKEGGGRRFGAVKPGQEVRWTYERDGKRFIAKLTAEERPDRPFLVAPEVTAEVETALEKLRAEQDRLREETRQSSRQSYEQSLQQMKEVQRSLERTRESLRRGGLTPSPDAPLVFGTAPRYQNLRYQGSIGGSDVEVRGSASIVVSEDKGEQELTISTPDAVIRIRKK